MRRSRRSKFAAWAVFILIAIVVLGNMAWATASSFMLARKTVTEDYERRVNAAVTELASYMAGVLNSETARDYRDYSRLHERIPPVAYTHAGEELDDVHVLLPSPLASAGPPHDWIDLYFQLASDAEGTDLSLSSPMIDDVAGLWPDATPDVSVRTQRTWDWLKSGPAGMDLRERVLQAYAATQDRTTNDVVSVAGTASRLATATGDPESIGHAVSSERSREEKKQSLQKTQFGYLRPPICVDAAVAARNVHNILDGEAGFQAEYSRRMPWGEIEIKTDPIATPFWLGAGPSGSQKMAFVRKCHLGNGSDGGGVVFYQGFVADWDRLKPELLAEISDQFPQAELHPIDGDSETTAGAFTAELLNLPVRLTVPDIPGGANAMAWRSVRPTLLTTWIAAAAVLAVAGWGLRNLVALTERRMQFAYSVTHELRTPLTTFRLYSDMLSAGLVPPESQQEYLDTLNRESERLSNLVEGVLEYARLENQKVRLNPSQTDGTSLLHALGETLSKNCGDNGVEARTENAISNGLRIHTDVDVVNRIAGVLIGNACRHARGTENAAVMLRLDGDSSEIHLDVIDTGPGIDRSDARAIFKPFRRGRKADATAQGGIGLGLALASNWAGLLGGRLELAARHDPQYGGARFRLRIPTQLKV